MSTSSPYMFEAEPKVVHNKPKYKEMARNESEIDTQQSHDIANHEANRTALNIMHNKRVFRGNTNGMNSIKKDLTPQQQEEMKVKNEREKKKVEMIKQQLISFKKNKNKQTPYDLRPGPPARIEVDLTYFLTEQNASKPDEHEELTQTDNFLPKPPTPPYIPKKTGIDATTQIWDNDLFDFDREVQPILNVLVSKSLEQAQLEVEEEHEISAIRRYKDEFGQRKKQEKDDWELEVKQELTRIRNKNKMVSIAREKKKRQIALMHKLRCLNVARGYLKNTLVNSVVYLRDHNFWRNGFIDEMKVDYVPWLVGNTRDDIKQTYKFKDDLDEILHEVIRDASAGREDLIKKREEIKKEKEHLMMIYSKETRFIRFLFNNLVPHSITDFAVRLPKLANGTLNEFEKEEKEKFEALRERINNEDLNETIEIPKPDPSPFFILDITNIQKLVFAVTDDPFFEIAAKNRKYTPEIIVFKQKDNLQSKVFGAESKETKSLKYVNNCRDKNLVENDDSKIEIKTKEMFRSAAQMALLVVRVKSNKENLLQSKNYLRARFRLLDYETYQTLDKADLNPGVDAEAANPDEEAGSEVLIVIGRLFKKKESLFYESITEKLNISDTLTEDLSNLVQNTINKRKLYDNKEKKNGSEDNNANSLSAKNKNMGGNKKKEEEARKKKEEEERKKKKEEEEKKANSLLIEDNLDPEAFIRHFKKFKNVTIGPLKFNCLNETPEQATEKIFHDFKLKNPRLYETCIFGIDIFVNERPFTNMKQLLCHGSQLKKVTLQPRLPPVQNFNEKEDEFDSKDLDNTE